MQYEFCLIVQWRGHPTMLRWLCPTVPVEKIPTCGEFSTTMHAVGEISPNSHRTKGVDTVLSTLIARDNGPSFGSEV